MSWFKGLLASIAALFRPRYRSVRVDDLPDELEPRSVYLIGEGDLPWQAAFLCPCRCGAVIQLSLVPRDRPSWRAIEHFGGSVSLYPSVWRKTGCQSHFFLRHGRIVGAPEARRAPAARRPAGR